MLRLGTFDLDPLTLPIHISPDQRQQLRGAANAAIAGQRDDQAPLAVGRGLDKRGGHGAGDEELAGIISRRVCLKLGERVLLNDAIIDPKGGSKYRDTSAWNP